MRPSMQRQAEPPISLLARSQLEPPQPSSQQAPPATSTNPIPTPLELATRLLVVINLTQDTHRVPYDYATKMCVEVTRSGRVFKLAASVTKPCSTSKATYQATNGRAPHSTFHFPILCLHQKRPAFS